MRVAEIFKSACEPQWPWRSLDEKGNVYSNMVDVSKGSPILEEELTPRLCFAA